MTDEQKFQQQAAQLRKPEGEAGIKTAEFMSKGNVHIIHNSLKVLHAAAGDNILEIGMGNGFYVNEILEQSDNIHYTGCDYSALMVQESEKLNSHWIEKGRAKFIQANITSLPFPNEQFNKVLTVNTIYFWDNEVAALDEIKRILQPSGKFIIGFRPKHQTENYPFTKYGFNQFSKEEVTSLLIENGFSIDDVVENKEPDFEVNGHVMKMENVVVVGCRI